MADTATATATDVRGRVLTILRDGRVTIRRAAGCYADSPGPQRIEAHVASSRPNHPGYTVDRWDDAHGSWACTCPAHLRTGEACPHVEAVRMCTGWPSEARR